MQYEYRVIPAAGKNAETLQKDLNEGGLQGFRMRGVVGSSDRQAEMVIQERVVEVPAAAPPKPVVGVVRGRLGHYDD